MAQADSVPSSSCQLITGESANQSTNLRAVNLPAVREEPANRGYLLGGSQVRAIIGGDEARPFRLWREKRGHQPDLLKRRYYGADAGQGPVGSNIVALFYVTLVFFLGRLLRRIVLSLLWFVSRNKRSRDSALDKVSSNQLVPSRPVGRPR